MLRSSFPNIFLYVLSWNLKFMFCELFLKIWLSRSINYIYNIIQNYRRKALLNLLLTVTIMPKICHFCQQQYLVNNSKISLLYFTHWPNAQKNIWLLALLLNITFYLRDICWYNHLATPCYMSARATWYYSWLYFP